MDVTQYIIKLLTSTEVGEYVDPEKRQCAFCDNEIDYNSTDADAWVGLLPLSQPRLLSHREANIACIACPDCASRMRMEMHAENHDLGGE